MKALIRSSMFIVVSVSLFSCFSQIPLSSSPSENNKSYQVEYLFEHEGCKVYRFLDHGHYVYFTNCKGDVTSIVNDSTQIRVINRVKN